MKEFISHSDIQTEEIAVMLAKKLAGGEVIAFRGDLGAGKTCFTRGLARGLGFTGMVNSPTFSLVNEYLGGRINLYHFDMYRVDNWEDLYSTGFFEYLDMGGVVAAEWSENIEGALPQNTIYITIEKLDENTRNIKICGVDNL
ncbi:MAG: tRNA (adenosine(37)-N6)-threonylcarbamoyltransferase complex ATPase subunit type 1 TsaE [Ruminococcaceae bacterium]|nr:tRNA (adenosine(37)-N6)-threonylcarbamoyltransferase complex ATPase subunit type 1 TsaE [Oscillospiraceae bacterium]